jgi:hypothetical protein
MPVPLQESGRLKPPIPGRRVALAALLFAGGCEANVVLLQPEQAATGDEITLEIQVMDEALAERLGWTPGTGVPGATVQIRRDETLEARSFVTDEDGVLELSDLPSARYWVWVEKRFDAPAPGMPAVLAGGRLMRLSRGSTAQIGVRGQERGSLVISEFYYTTPASELVNWTAYKHHWYVELRNDADTTIYLDGKIIGTGFQYDIDSPAWPCTVTSPWRNEPRGVWAQSFQQFPGGGGDHPVAPGGVVVIAEQAIDHSAIFPGLPDLSHADFQFSWEDRAMNPAVPTMLPIALRVLPAASVMGLLKYVPFLAVDVNVDALEQTQNLQGTFALFPREQILDLAQLEGEIYLQPTHSSLCGNLVDLSLDALAAFAVPYSALRPDAHMLAAQRKTLPDGSLQRTGVSAADWEIRERSPGRVP